MMIVVIYINSKINKIDIAATLPLVSEQRREKTLLIKNELGQRLSLAVYMLLKKALKTEYGIDENPIFDFHDGGKPFIVGHPDIHFNMSHCQRAAACAVSISPVGIDIESPRRVSDTLAQHVLNDDELHQMHSTDDPEREFLRLWTKKESLLKLTGTGLRADLKKLLPCPNAEFNVTETPDYVCTVCRYAD